MKAHRIRRSLVSIATIAVAMLLVFATGAGAVHDLEFQLEGNTADDAASAQDFDWESFFTNTGAESPVLPHASRPGFTASGFKPDYVFPDTSAYATGSKDTLPISGWQCKKSNNIGGKFDVMNAYAVAYTNPSDGHLVLYFGVERAATEGSGNVGVWFLKDGTVDCSTNGGGNQDWSGGHVDGDVFVVSEFTDGGNTAHIAAYRWNGGEGGSLSEDPIVTGGKCGVGTEQEINGRKACAIVNSAPLNTIWPSPDKSGGDVDTNAFFEGGVDLGALGDSGCFATFVANSRSSFEPGATIHDFARGSLPVCRPSTKLRMTASALVTFKFYETNDGNVPLSPSLLPTTTPAGCSAVTYVSGDTAPADGKLSPGETWLFTCTKTVETNLVTNSASFSLTGTGHGQSPLGDVTWCTSGPACDTDERDSVTVTVTNNTPND